MDNDALVEAIYSGDEFHSEILSMVAKHGRGEAIAIVWDRHDTNPQKRILAGMVVCQLQYGQAAYHFKVSIGMDRYTLFFRGKQKTVDSDYFQPF